MKMVQMDSLTFYDNFSYINYLELRLNFYDLLKFRAFSEIIKSFKIYLNSRKELLRQHDLIVTSAGQQVTVRSNLTVGPACQCN